ncbi:MAG: YcxB family protein [Armatimonadota bacterium]
MPDTHAAPRRYQFSVRIEPEPLRDASLLYMWRRFRWRYVAGWAGAGLGAAAYSLTDLGLLTTVLGVIVAVLALVLIAYPFAIWYAVRRTVEGYTELTGGMPVRYEADEQWLVSDYAGGSGELHWSDFESVLKTENMWLLVLSTEERFIPLPIDQVPDDALQFIESQIEADGSDS